MINQSNTKNLFIFSILNNTKDFLTSKELLICLSLNKENEKDFNEIAIYTRKRMCCECNEIYKNVLYKTILQNITLKDEIDLIMDGLEIKIENKLLDLILKHFDLIQKSTKLKQLLTLIQFKLIRNHNYIRNPKYNVILSNVETIMLENDNISKNYPTIYNTFHNIYRTNAEYPYIIIAVLEHVLLIDNGFIPLTNYQTISIY